MGWGLENDVVQIYDFVSNNFKANDELFFFGFSRGAYTVRSAAGLISDVGILSAIHMSSFDAMWKAYRARDRAEPFQNSEWYMSNKDIIRLKDIPIKVVGVFDTVGALVSDLAILWQVTAHLESGYTSMALGGLAKEDGNQSPREI